MKKAGQGWGRRRSPRLRRDRKGGHSHRADVMWPRDPQIVSGDHDLQEQDEATAAALGTRRGSGQAEARMGEGAFRSRFQFTHGTGGVSRP